MGLESGYPAENMLISIALPSQQCPSERLLLIEVFTVELFAISTETAMNQSFIFLENAPMLCKSGERSEFPLHWKPPLDWICLSG